MLKSMEFTSFPSVGASAVQAVLYADVLERRQKGYEFVSSSLPGHLIQAVIEGHTRHDANGRLYELGPRSLIWYHEDELVRGRVIEAPWRFFTVNFIAPALSPPPFEARVRGVGAAVMKRLEALVLAWRNTSVAPAERELRVHARLSELLADLTTPASRPYRMDPVARLWWDLETLIRRDLRRPVSLGLMENLTGKSQATIARACCCAVGVPPMKRIKQIRMSLARGLVQRSSLTISEIADRVGYARIHEFSRDFRKHFTLAPREDRAAHA